MYRNEDALVKVRLRQRDLALRYDQNLIKCSSINKNYEADRFIKMFLDRR